MNAARDPSDFTAADWRDPVRLRAKVHGAVARYREPLTAPEHGGATLDILRQSMYDIVRSPGCPAT
jgi:hypothetical protein